MFFIRFFRILFVASSIVILCTKGSLSQEQEPPALDKTAGVAWRVGFWELIHQTFSSDEDHPFYQMTGTSRFKGGQGFFGFTFLDPGSNGIIPTIQNKNDDGHQSKDRTLTKLFSYIPILNGLPPFSLEYILPTELIVGVSLCFNHTNIWLDDQTSRAATSGADPTYATPLLRMASHLYMFSASLHPFGVPAPDDIDIFLGFGFSRVESTIRYGIKANPAIEDYAPVTKTQVSGSTGTMPFRRMGIASGGDSFGFMLEFLFPGKREVIDNPFYADTIIDSTIYNATYNNQGESLPTKVGIPGGITRLSWTYSF
ncbi:MAG: hypothetical protein CL935_00875 [Deltaproteobacteria bacterium]|nr:hypothetical protein [Deltaproteobacteria bacterium]